MSPFLSTPDLRFLFYGGGLDAERAFLLNAYNAGITAAKMISSSPVLWLPSGAQFETFSRKGAGITSVGALTSQRLFLAYAMIPGTTPLSTITFATAATQGAMTNQWFALYSYDATAPAKLAVTADDGSTAWAQNTTKTLYVSRSVTDAAISSSVNTTTLTSATAAFTSADVGKQVTVMGAGAAGVPLGTSAARVTISSVTNATTAIVSAAASTTVSGATAYIATPYTPTAAAACYLGIMLNGTVANIDCVSLRDAGIAGTAPVIAQAADTGLTAATTAPNPAANLATSSAYPWAYAA